MVAPIVEAHAFLAEGGDAGALMRDHDWSASPLGLLRSWPQSLRSVVGLLLGSKFPMFVAWGPELSFLYNDAYAEILGAKHPSALGSRFQDIWPEIWNDISPIVSQALKGNSTYHENLPLTIYRRGHGEQAWFTFSYSPTRDESGKVAGMFCVVTETTSQVLANRRKDEFLAMLAHELRNPLAPIATAAELLKLSTFEEGRVRKTSEVISRQVAHMTELVDDLLDVSRVTRGLVTLQEETLNVSSVLADAIEQTHTLMETKRHRFSVQVHKEQFFIKGDRTRLIQVFSNLLNNAAKYTSPEGHITLRVEGNEAEVQVVVEDNGIGVAPSLQSHIFDLFTQAERTPDRAQGGLGLGLALVKSLIELHGGQVAMHSEGVGKGSVFTVILPRENGTNLQVKHIGLESGLPPGSNAAHVLIVDDNRDAADTLSLLLQTLGHEVSVSYNPVDALTLAQRISPAVMFVDIGLPDMDGFELARRLRAIPETEGSLLVAVTGYGQPQDKEHALEAGFDYHLVKPISLGQVVELLATVA